MFKRIFLASILSVGTLTAAPVRAETKIATVDIARILNESPDAAAKKKELDNISQEAKRKADDKRKALQALEQKLKEKKVADDSKEADNFRNEAKEYARYVKDTEEDLKKKFIKVNREITEKALSQVAAYAKSNKIDLVLDKSDKGRGPVLFGNPGVDITDQILEEMDS